MNRNIKKPTAVLILGILAAFSVFPAFAAAPSNDDFDDATVISELAFSDSIDTTGATTADDDPDCAGQGPTVWYAFTPEEDIPVRADTGGSDYDTTLSVYTGSRGKLTQIACNDADVVDGQSSVEFETVAGETYFFMVGASGSGPGGQLFFSVDIVPLPPSPPSNDDFDDATVISELPFSDSIDTTGATTADDDPGCFGQGSTVWYAFTPEEDIPVRADTGGSDYLTTVSVYTGSRSKLTQIACSVTRVEFEAAAGETYFFMVNAGGQLVFSVDITRPPSNDDFDDATVISELPFFDPVDTRDATIADDDPECFGQGPTVWYAFTPDEDVNVRANAVGSDYSATVSVYTGPRDKLAQIACNENTAGVQFEAVAGETYFFMVNAGGQLVFSVDIGPPPPSNDDFDDATIISALPFSDSVDTLSATTADDDPECFGQGPTVWYVFTPEEDIPVRANTSADYLATVSVYTDSRGKLTQIACDNQGRMQFEAVAGETYFFMIGGQFGGGPGGQLDFSVDTYKGKEEQKGKEDQ